MRDTMVALDCQEKDMAMPVNTSPLVRVSSCFITCLSSYALACLNNDRATSAEQGLCDTDILFYHQPSFAMGFALRPLSIGHGPYVTSVLLPVGKPSSLTLWPTLMTEFSLVNKSSMIQTSCAVPSLPSPWALHCDYYPLDAGPMLRVTSCSMASLLLSCFGWLQGQGPVW